MIIDAIFGGVGGLEQLASGLDLTLAGVPEVGVDPRVDVCVEGLFDDRRRQNVGLPAGGAVQLDVALGPRIARFHFDAEPLKRPNRTMEMRPMRLVIVESPYAGDVEANAAYARAAVKDSLLRGEAPIASHLLYTQSGILDDAVPEERRGIDARLAWRAVADAFIVYTDLGISRGMKDGIGAARDAGVTVEFRSLKEIA